MKQEVSAIVNLLRDWQDRVAHSRRLGNTTALIDAARQRQGTLVCASQIEADAIKHETQAHTCSIYKAPGVSTPGLLFFDNHAIQALLNMVASTISNLQEEIDLRDEMIRFLQKPDQIQKTQTTLPDRAGPISIFQKENKT